MASIDALFDKLLSKKGSDLHLAVGLPPMGRIRGELGAPSVLVHNAVAGGFGAFDQVVPLVTEALDRAADHAGDALLHLAGGLVGEGDGQDLAGPGEALVQDVREPGGEHPGLAGAGPRQHQHGGPQGRRQQLRQQGSAGRSCGGHPPFSLTARGARPLVPYRFEYWKRARAPRWPYFLRSPLRASRVRWPASRSASSSVGSYALRARATPSSPSG